MSVIYLSQAVQNEFAVKEEMLVNDVSWFRGTVIATIQFLRKRSTTKGRSGAKRRHFWQLDAGQSASSCQIPSPGYHGWLNVVTWVARSGVLILSSEDHGRVTGYGNALNAEDMTHFDASIDLYIQGNFPRSRKTKIARVPGGLSGAFASQLVWFNKSAEAGKTALVGIHELATLGLRQSLNFSVRIKLNPANFDGDRLSRSLLFSSRLTQYVRSGRIFAALSSRSRRCGSGACQRAGNDQSLRSPPLTCRAGYSCDVFASSCASLLPYIDRRSSTGVLVSLIAVLILLTPCFHSYVS
ncbi:hypothetical protein KCU67_g56, partial [Aureobasidium melanogenum]